MKTIWCFFLFCFVAMAAISQTTLKGIPEINSAVQNINNYQNYDSIILTNHEFLDSGFIYQPSEGYGKLTGFFRNDTLIKIKEEFGLRLLHDNALIEYYFYDYKLIFVYEEENYNPQVITDNDGTVDYKKEGNDFEAKYYFTDIDMTTVDYNGEPQIIPNQRFFDSQSKGGQLISSASKNAELLNVKNKSEKSKIF